MRCNDGRQVRSFLGVEILQEGPELMPLVRVSEGGTVATMDTNIGL